MMTGFADWPFVWCDNCQETKPLRLDHMPANKNNDHDALDLMCDECDSIIATLHAAPVKAAT